MPPIAVAFALALPSGARADEELKLGRVVDEGALAALVWESGLESQQARATIADAASLSARSRLLPNPQLGLTLGTLPLGETNPVGLSRLDVPNAGVAASELIEIGKRGPRQIAADAALAATREGARDIVRTGTLALLGAAGDVAAAELRVGVYERLADDARELSRLAADRTRLGDAAGLEADRARLEESRAQADLAVARRDLESMLAVCSRLAGRRCLPFADPAEAKAFLGSRRAIPATLSTDRPDLVALAREADAARAESTLALARAIPDVTVQAGYLYDRFVASGNQRHSVNIGVSIPVPLFDAGRDDAAAATIRAEAAEGRRHLLVARAEQEMKALRLRIGAIEARRQELTATVIPVAEGVVTQLAGAVKSGGATLSDILLARRSLSALLLDAVTLDGDAFAADLDLAAAAGWVPPLPPGVQPT